MPRTEGKNYHLHNIFGSLERTEITEGGVIGLMLLIEH